MTDESISIEDAIAELSQPTGDPERDGVRLSFAENMRRGLMVPSGRSADGDITVKLTAAGKRFVEEMGKHG